MDLSAGIASTQLVALPSGDPLTFAVAGGVAAIVTIAVRYGYSTRFAAFFIATVMLFALSPLTTTVLGVDPRYFLGGFLSTVTVGGTGDYVYQAITGKDTGVQAFRTVTGDWIDLLRDRRRTVRRRLEDILDRKTIIAVLVGMPLTEFVKVTVVQVLGADPIQWNLAWAHLVLMLFGLAIGVHWERIKRAAGDAGDQAEEMMNGEE